MYLQIKPSQNNTFPLSGILIRGNSLRHWLQQLQSLRVNLQQVPVYVIPGSFPNSVWGCFAMLPLEQWKEKTLNANEPCQYVYHNLYIPAYATIYPLLNAAEAAKLFANAPHILHPEFGLVALENPIVWSELLIPPGRNEHIIDSPQPAPFIPKEIKHAEIHALPPEEVIKSMEERDFPSKEKFSDKPLNWVEKIKLGILKTLFGSAKTGENKEKKDKNLFTKWVEKISDKMGPRVNQWIQQQQENLQDLERRNQTEMEKLMALFKNNPEEALKYAIPLDEGGTGRGGTTARFEMSKLRNNFDLFGRSNANGGSTSFEMDVYQKLQQQYNETARSLIAQKDYRKAAFVYMKLLKNNQLAAQTLEDGKMHAEAASIYLKYLQNKAKAAECYEKGQMFSDAIELYKELNENEKVGDLYMMQQKKEAAFEHYQIVAENYIANSKYVKASLLYKNKMGNAEPAQVLLLKGWREQKDAFNCINNYFENIDDKQQLLDSIEHIYEKEVDQYNMPVFLTALNYEQKKSDAIGIRAKEMAYEIVATLAASNPDIVSELKNFNKDTSLTKDVLRYKIRRKDNST